MRIPYCEVNTKKKKRPTPSIYLYHNLIHYSSTTLAHMHHNLSSLTSYHVLYLLPHYHRTTPPEYIPVTPPYSHTVSIYICSLRPSWAAKTNFLSSRLLVYTLLIPSGTVRTPSHCPSSPKIYTDTPLQEIVYSTPFLTNCMETNPVIPKSVMPRLST